MSEKTQAIQLFATAPYPCSYLDGNVARSQVATPSHLVDSHVYEQLMECGFRRSGLLTYRPHCGSCNACKNLRIPVADFALNRTQRKTWRKHAQLDVRLLPPDFHPEHYALYRRYLDARHKAAGMDNGSEQDYEQFLLNSRVDTRLVEFRQWNEGQQASVVRMVSVVDFLPHSLSAVYTFYEPHLPAAGLGTYSILWLIDLAQRLQMHHLYLGYWIAQSQKMAYKANYYPHEILHEGQWLRVEKPQ